MLKFLNDITSKDFAIHSHVAALFHHEEDDTEHFYPARVVLKKRPIWTKVDEQGNEKQIRCIRDDLGKVFAPSGTNKNNIPVPEGANIDDCVDIVFLDQGKRDSIYAHEMFVEHPISYHLESSYFEQGDNSLMMDKLDGVMRVQVSHPLVEDKLFKFFYNFGASPYSVHAHLHLAAQKGDTSKVDILRPDGTQCKIDIENMDLHVHTADRTDQCFTYNVESSKWSDPVDVAPAKVAQEEAKKGTACGGSAGKKGDKAKASGGGAPSGSARKKSKKAKASGGGAPSPPPKKAKTAKAPSITDLTNEEESDSEEGSGTRPRRNVAATANSPVRTSLRQMRRQYMEACKESMKALRTHRAAITAALDTLQTHRAALTAVLNTAERAEDALKKAEAAWGGA